MKLSDHFERVVVINLPYKPERRARLEQHLAELGLAKPSEIQWVRAISGEMCPPPVYFKGGGGAWGCLHSHLRVVQDAIMDRLDNYLVLEDDVVFHCESASSLARFMREIPADWGQLYLGGQHLAAPEAIAGSPFVVRGKNINRTHAFALKKNTFSLFQQHVTHAPDYIAKGAWHIDHQLGIAHGRRDWNTYCPAWWIAGQEEGPSNISGRKNPRFWWHYKGFSSQLPFIFIDPPPADSDSRCKLRKHIHVGNNLKENTLEDVGLDACVGSPGKLRDWLAMIAGEAIGLWKLPGICHPSISYEDVAREWSAGVILSRDASLEKLANYPSNRLFPHPLNAASEGAGGIPRRISAA